MNVFSYKVAVTAGVAATGVGVIAMLVGGGLGFTLAALVVASIPAGITYLVLSERRAQDAQRRDADTIAAFAAVAGELEAARDRLAHAARHEVSTTLQKRMGGATWPTP